MSHTEHLPELESLRSQVGDLSRKLAERDQSMQDLREQSDLLRAIVEGTTADTGDEFFALLATHLTASLHMQYAVIGEIVDGTPVTIRTVAVASGGALLDNFEYDLTQAPCGTALTESFWCYEQGVQALFPNFPPLGTLGVDSHSGVSIRNKQGDVMGLIVVMDTRPITNHERLQSLLKVFVPRVAAELQRKHTETALQQQTQRLAHAQALAHLGSWDWDVDSGEVRWSDEQFRIFGHEPGAISVTYDTFLASLHPNDHDPALAVINDALLGKAPYDIECRIVCPNGEVRSIHALGDVHRDATGHPLSMAGTVLDITERKQVEDALRTSEARFRTTFEKAAVGMYLCDLDGRICQVNPAMCRILGYTKQELLARDFQSITHPEDLQANLPRVEQLVKEQFHSLFIEKRHLHKDGSFIWVHASVSVIHDHAGRPNQLLAMVQDISERKRAEEALAQSERQLRTVLDALPVGVWFTDPSGKPVLANPAAKQIWSGIKQVGIETSAHAAGWWEEIGPSSEPHRWALSPVLIRGVPSLNETLDLECLDGTRKTIRNSAVPVQDENGVVLGAILLNEDITALRQAQEALKLTQFSVDHAVEGFFWIGPDARILNANDAACQMLEYTRDELTTLTVHDIDPNFPPELWSAHWEELKQKGSMTFETKHWSRTGRVLDTEVTVNYLQYEGREYNCAIMRDIGERKRADAALRESEELFAKAFRSSPYPIVLSELETGLFLDANDAAFEIFGYHPGEVSGRTAADIGLWQVPEDRLRFVEYLKQVGSIRNLEVGLRNKAGEVRQCLVSAELIGLHGKRCIVTVGHDITEQKRAEEALRASEERYRSLVDNAPIGIFVNEAGRFVYANREMQRILKATSVEQLIGTPVLDRIAPEFHTVVKDRIHELIKGQPVPSLDEQFVRLDGSRVDVAVTAIPTSFDGTPVMQVLVLDITDRKRMEEALRQREQDLRVAIEERERISQDLHDGILQSLFAVGLTLETTKSMMSPRNRKMSGPPFDQAIDQLNRVMHEIRNFIAGLGSDLLQGKDLPTALQHMLESLTQNHATRVRLAVEDRAAQAVSAEQSLHLLHVIQEAVSNCIRHGHAQEATVSLKMLKQGVRLSIRDNGSGFNPDAAKGTGHGLINMAARAQKIGGRFTVLSKVNEGTRVVLDLPKEASSVRR